jgi:hypothetical protein
MDDFLKFIDELKTDFLFMLRFITAKSATGEFMYSRKAVQKIILNQSMKEMTLF